jgi:hypothetical protein
VNGEVHGGRPRPTGAVVPRGKKTTGRPDSSTINKMAIIFCNRIVKWGILIIVSF